MKRTVCTSLNLNANLNLEYDLKGRDINSQKSKCELHKSNYGINPEEERVIET